MARNIEKREKKGNAHCRCWSISRKLKIMENEKHTLWDMEYDKNTEKRAN
jgi:hypothetical protein